MNHMPQIRRLDETTANQIAAGEVVERPAAVVKELVENAIDAGATQISIRYQDGGKTLIEVRDNGVGIPPEELPLAIERHATSKLDSNDLQQIASFGFRGEALPSIGAVARLEIISKRQDREAMAIAVTGGKIETPYPSSHNIGTTVRVRDLFYATPARLKFQGTDRAESMAIGDVVKRLAMARPDISFELTDASNDKIRKVLKLPALEANAFSKRLETVLGKDALTDCIAIEAEHDGVKLNGFLGLPTAARGSASAQYFFVNERPVRDKLFFGAVKGAYSDLLPSGKFPFIVLYMRLAPEEIDVNVHPAKTEIRFRKAAAIRSFVLNAIRHRFAEEGLRADHHLSSAVMTSFQSAPASPSHSNYQMPLRPSQSAINTSMETQLPGLAEEARSFEPQERAETDESIHYPLGFARAQYHQNYIIAENSEGLIIIDQHAAHERLVYEKLKNQYAEKRLTAQRLLVPEIITLGAMEREGLLSITSELAKLGLEIEAFGVDAIAVQAVPAPISGGSVQTLVKAVIDELENDPKAAINKRVDHLLATMACHGSVRSGRKLRIEEMNALLREMEATPNSGTCNHGRPTFIKLDLKSLEARFGR